MKKSIDETNTGAKRPCNYADFTPNRKSQIIHSLVQHSVVISQLMLSFTRRSAAARDINPDSVLSNNLS